MIGVITPPAKSKAKFHVSRCIPFPCCPPQRLLYYPINVQAVFSDCRIIKFIGQYCSHCLLKDLRTSIFLKSGRVGYIHVLRRENILNQDAHVLYPYSQGRGDRDKSLLEFDCVGRLHTEVFCLACTKMLQSLGLLNHEAKSSPCVPEIPD